MNQYVRGVLTDTAVSKIRRAAQHAENAKQALINARYYDCHVMDELKCACASSTMQLMNAGKPSKHMQKRRI